MASHKRQGSSQIQGQDQKRPRKAPEEPPQDEPADTKLESENLILEKLPLAEPADKIKNESSTLKNQSPFELADKNIIRPNLSKDKLFLDLAGEVRKSQFFTFENPSFVEPSDEEIRNELAKFDPPPHIEPANALSQGAGAAFSDLIPHTIFTIAVQPPSILDFGMLPASQESIMVMRQPLCYCCQFLIRFAIIKCAQDNGLSETEVISLSKRRYHVKPLNDIGLCDIPVSDLHLPENVPLDGLFRVAIVVINKKGGLLMVLGSNEIVPSLSGVLFSLLSELSVRNLYYK